MKNGQVYFTISFKNCQSKGQWAKKQGKGQNPLSISTVNERKRKGCEGCRNFLTDQVRQKPSKRNILAKMSKQKQTTKKTLFDFVHAQLTTSRKEHQVTREEAGRGSNRLAIQEKDHVTNRVSRGEESLKVQTAECNGVPVGERAGDKRAAL